MKYESPKILREVTISTREDLLAGSVVEKAEVESMGQEVVTYDFSDFDYEWY